MDGVGLPCGWMIREPFPSRLRRIGRRHAPAAPTAPGVPTAPKSPRRGAGYRTLSTGASDNRWRTWPPPARARRGARTGPTPAAGRHAGLSSATAPAGAAPTRPVTRCPHATSGNVAFNPGPSIELRAGTGSYPDCASDHYCDYCIEALYHLRIELEYPPARQEGFEPKEARTSRPVRRAARHGS